MKRQRLRRWSGTVGAAWLLTLAALSVGAATPRRVLILEPFSRDVAPFNALVAGLCSTLARDLAAPVEFQEVPLDLARPAGAEGEAALVSFLEGQLREQPVDLVLPIGGPGAQFAARHRARLFPVTPMLLVAPAQRLVPPGLLAGPNVSLITGRVNIPGMVEDILRLQPQTTNIAVVFGTSPLEQFWVGECRREFQAFTNRVGFTWLNELPLEQVVERCTRLPPRSFILHVYLLTDGAGVPCEDGEPLRRLHESANAPLFGYFASEFGRGIIGGRLFPDREIGREAARAAVRILRGERAGNLPPRVLEATGPVFDWRELHRWHIPENRLPDGAGVQFRQPGVWRQYRLQILGAAGVGLLQAALILGLLVNRSRWHRGEAEAALIADISSKFVNLPPGELDRAIRDALGRLCGPMRLDFAALWLAPGAGGESFTLTHSPAGAGGPALPQEASLAGHFPWSQQRLLAGEVVAVGSLRELPVAAARDEESYRALGIRSQLLLPLTMDGAPPLAVLSVGTTRKERAWPAGLVQRLQLVAQIFANALVHRQSEQARREAEERMGMAAEAAEFGVWVWDVTGNRVWGSERWRNLFGFGPEEDITWEKVIGRLPPEERERLEADVWRSVAERSRFAGEYRLLLPDGTLRWVASRGRPDYDAAGRLGRVLGASVDITARKAADARFRLAVEASPNGMVIVDDRGHIVMANAQIERLFGYAREELVGQSIQILVPERVRDGHRADITAFLSGPQARAMGKGRDLFARRKDGSEFPVEIGLSTIHSPEGVLVLTAVLDITLRKQAEAALRDFSRRLIRAHEEERTRLARELHDDVTQRVARLAIDAGRLEQGADPKAAGAAMSSLREGLVRLGEDIHALSYRLHPAVLQDLGLAEALKAECERFSRQESLAVEVKLRELPEEVALEPSLCLFRVAQEALRNVARHARARRVEVALRLLGGGLQLAVIDDGTGFDQAAQRERPSLGLASMRERVHLLGGELDIESAPGQGTTILVWVPIKEEKS